MMINVNRRRDWKQIYEPQGELIAQIANPQAFKVYYDHKMRQERTVQARKDGKIVAEKGEEVIKNNGGETIYAEANTHYDPALGLVDNNGKVIIAKEQYDKILGVDGIAVSF